MSDKNRNETLYIHLREFIKVAGMTNKSFAEFADLKHSTFQGMLNRNTGMKQETYNKIVSGMINILAEYEEIEDFDRLKKLESLFFQFMIDSDSVDNTNRTDSANPFLSRIHSAFDRMNEQGQEIAADRIEELSQIPAYQKKEKDN